MKDLIQIILDLKEKIEAIARRQKEFLSLPDAAWYIGISESTMYKHTSNNIIPHYKPHGKLITFKKSELDVWLTANRIPSKNEIDESLKGGKYE